MSKAVITMTDTADGIDVRLVFDPPVATGGRVSGARWLAGEMLKVAAKIVEQSETDEGDA